MRHQPFVAFIVASKLAEIVGLVLFAGKQLGEARNAGVDRITDAVNHFRVWQREVDQSGEVKVRRHLVGDAVLLQRQLEQ